MCGIFGAYDFRGHRLSDAVANAMGNRLAHRGPDAEGHYLDSRALVGNRRLSILDLSVASNQPLFSEDGRFTVVQNGEIYNYIELRDELSRKGIKFKTTGDTEVVLRAFEHWGDDFVTKLNGMFAIAIYDIKEERLRLYRDRIGVKPLFFADDANSGTFWFASEIKSILANGENYPPNMDALAQYFALNYIPSPHTAFSGIQHLPPASKAVIDRAGTVRISQYWNLANCAPDKTLTEADAKARLLYLLDDATRLRMRSDAPYGAFLSGGLDSSSVVAMMSLYQQQSLRTFSIGFDDKRFDESSYALKASRRFGTLHQKKTMQPSASALWPTMIWYTDQPHGDVSFMPMLQVSELAARDVKMVLTGDGGDELFAGYEKYQWLENNVDGADWERSYVKRSGLLMDDEPDKLLRGELRDAFFDEDPYRELVCSIAENDSQDPINQVLLAETKTLLPGNNLVKPDRMAMAKSIEIRSPYLDYRMAELAFSIPGQLKLRNGETKWILKRAVEPILGRELTFRKKQMFTVPVGEWFRQNLADFCRATLLDGRLEARGIVNIGYVEEMLTLHIEGKKNNTRQLRALISLELWYRLFVDDDPETISKALGQPGEKDEESDQKRPMPEMRE